LQVARKRTKAISILNFITLAQSISKMKAIQILSLIVSMALLQACGSDNPNRGKPIVLGDQNTIVTEADSQYLQDFVADIKPVQPVAQQEAPKEDTVAKQMQAEKEAIPQQEIPKQEEPKQEVKTPSVPKGVGLNITFKEITVLIPNINTRSYKLQDPKKANGVSYELMSGNLNGNQIKTGGGKVSRVLQRYQTVIAIKSDNGTLVLESLNRTTNWQTLRGGNNAFTISGLDNKRLECLKATPAAIRNAVNRAARNKRMSKATEQKWLKAISRVRSVNDRPLVIMLRSVMWKIEGKASDGKPYQKQIRLDIPLK
jgi:hypothetical protein